jgi:threonine dehydrogenase-like Zn-dependent dehydrogenase
MRTLKKAMLHDAGDLRIEEQHFDPDHLAPDQVWVKTVVSAFKIGTDRGNFEGAEYVPGAPTYPRGVGDSNLGVVQKVGSAVTHLRPGARVVAVENHQSDYIATADQGLIEVPEGVADDDAVFANLYGLSAHCYHKAWFRPGETVAVVGLGTLGLGCVALGPAFGARVIGVGNSDLRNEWASKVGAHETVLYNDPHLAERIAGFTEQRGIDLVILTANPWPAYQTAVEICRIDGRVAIVSLLGRGETGLDFNPLKLEWFYNKGISLIAVSRGDASLYPPAVDGELANGAQRHRRHVLQLMADGLVKPSTLVTHRLPYSELVTAYQMALARDKNMMNVLFDWSEA